MKFSELIDMCIECVKSFNPVINTIDSHADNFLSGMKDPYEKVFVKQIFYGCIRYQDFLKVFTTVFFKRHPIGTNRNDIVIYQVFSYVQVGFIHVIILKGLHRTIYCQTLFFYRGIDVQPLLLQTVPERDVLRISWQALSLFIFFVYWLVIYDSG